MPKINPHLIENKKSIELVQELEKYEIKKSPLSIAARGKVINKSGSGYVSEDREGYGPGNSQSSDEVARYAGKQAVSRVTGSLLGPAALPVGAGLKVASQTIDMMPKAALMLIGIGADGKRAKSESERHKLVDDFFEGLINSSEAEKSGFAK